MAAEEPSGPSSGSGNVPEAPSSIIRWPGFGRFLQALFNAAADARQALTQIAELRLDQKRQGDKQTELLREVAVLAERLRAANDRIAELERRLEGRISDAERRIDERVELLLLRRQAGEGRDQG